MSGIPIYLRLKPFIGITSDGKTNNIKIASDDEIEVTGPKNFLNSSSTGSRFTFTKIFNEETSQLKVFRHTAESLVDNVLAGNDSSVFTVGPSGSGKSFTTLGSATQPGLLVYSLHKAFEAIKSMDDNAENTDSQMKSSYLNILQQHYGSLFVAGPGMKTTISTIKTPKQSGKKHFISLNIFELYTDTVVDLLESECDNYTLRKTRSMRIGSSKEIVTDSKDGKVKPSGLIYYCVHDINDAQKLINKAIKKRHVSSTEMNLQSSRSHIFIYVNFHQVGVQENDTEATVISSRLTVADLAGSERLKSTKTTSQRKEGNITNLSLSELGRVLQTISSLKKPLKESDKAILRSSKMTRLLFADYLGNKNHRLIILVNIDPFADSKIIASVLRIIKPADRYLNTESVKDTPSSATTSPSKTKVMMASTVHKPSTQLRLVQSPGSITRNAISRLTQSTQASQARIVSPSHRETSSMSKRISPSKINKSPIRLNVSPSKVNTSPTKVNTSPIRLDTTNTSTLERVDTSGVKMSRSPTRLIRTGSLARTQNSELRDKVGLLEQEVEVLKGYLEQANEYIAQNEFRIRQDAAQEYAIIIESIEKNHRELMDKFEATNIKSTDERIEMLEKEMKEEIEKLRQDNRDLLKENSKTTTNYEQLLFKHEMDLKALRELESQIHNFNNDNIKLKHENLKLKTEVEKLRKWKSDHIGFIGHTNDFEQIKEALAKRYEMKIKDYDSKINSLSEKLKMETERNIIMTNEFHHQEPNAQINSNINLAKNDISAYFDKNVNANNDLGVKKRANSKRQKTRKSDNVLRESLDTSINILPQQLKPIKKSKHSKKATGESKKSGKRALKKPKKLVMYEENENF